MSDMDLWQFSCTAYEGKQNDFLRLQDDFGLQVNMLLVCGFYGGRGFAIGNMAELVRIADRWDGVLVGLRELRREAKGSESYADYKRVELELEELCQLALTSAVVVSKGGSVASNIDIYLALRSCTGAPIEAIVHHLEEVSHGQA